MLKRQLYNFLFVRLIISINQIRSDGVRRVVLVGHSIEDKILCFLLKKLHFDAELFSLDAFDSNLIKISASDYLYVSMDSLLHKKISKLIDCGVRQNQIHYHYFPVRKLNINKELDVYDPLLGFTCAGDNTTGYTILGDVEKAELIVAVLGNSTTELGFAHLKSWVDFFYEKMNLKKTCAVICGGVRKNNTSQELIRLIRDIIPKRPDIVISVDGICNNAASYKDKLVPKHPYIWNWQKEVMKKSVLNKRVYDGESKTSIKSVSYGLCDERSFAEWWLDDIRMMHSICTEFGIKYLSFLQPSVYIGDYAVNGAEHLPSDSRYVKEHIKWYNRAREMAKGYSYIIDTSDLLENESDVFWDTVHLYEKGNAILAEKIVDCLNNMT